MFFSKKRLLKIFKPDARLRKVKSQFNDGYSSKIGFLHIPKTGGTSINGFGKLLISKGYNFPTVFNHEWSVKDIVYHFSNIKLTFVLRDPLSRIISGFNSRLRQGRPTFNHMWSSNEASAFALFPSAEHLLDAMLSDEDYQKSSLGYAMKSIIHLKTNYAFYFRDTDYIESENSRFQLIGNMEDYDDYIDKLTILSGAPKSLADELYEKRHVSSLSVDSILSKYSTDDHNKLKRYLSRDYKIYNKLMSLRKKD
jgi:hypothetical protein